MRKSGLWVVIFAGAVLPATALFGAETKEEPVGLLLERGRR